MSQAKTWLKVRFVFKHAVQRMPEVIEEALAHNKCQLSDVSLFLFHQANLRINEFVSQKLGIPPERTYNNIQKFGNCSAASIPMLLHECVEAGRVREGDLIAMAGFGSGFTWGSARSAGSPAGLPTQRAVMGSDRMR
jgi:3-oxoacyl-[acyl-carrier-protein] synthase-3